MKFTINQTDLLPVLGTAVKIIPSKPSLPALGCFLLNIKDNKLKITASDAETTICFVLPVTTDGKAGKALIEGSFLYNAVREMPKENITFDFDLEKHKATLDWGTGRSTLPILDPDTFPTAPKVEDAATLDVPAEVLKTAISNTVFAAADDEMRPVMNGILFDLQKDTVTLVASNTRILTTSRLPETKADKEGQYIIHKKPMGILNNILTKAEGTVKMQFSGRNSRILIGNCLITTRLIDGKFPAYRSVMPSEKNINTTVCLKKEELVGSIRRMSVYKTKDINYLSLLIKNGEITLASSEKSEARAHERLEGTCDGDDLMIHFNIENFESIVSNMPFSDVKLCIQDAQKAVLLSDNSENCSDETKMIIMPSMAA